MQRLSGPETGPGAILWDGFGLQSLHSGVGRHAWDLLKALERAGVPPRIIPSVPALDSAFAPYMLASGMGWPRSRLKPWALFWTSRWLAGHRRERENTGILHGLSNYNIPIGDAGRLRRVLTVHDLIPVLQKAQVSKALGLYLRYQLPRALAAADAIICVSHWTEATLHEHYPVSRGKTVMIPNGWPGKRGGDPPEPGARLLTISRWETYKRLDLIPAILGRLPAHFRWTLVCDAAGFERMRGLGDPRLILKTGISEREIQDLHAAADLYVHPSLLEGFCLPAAASISQGVPVVFTRGSGIDEVVGEAGQGLNPEDSVARWAEAIQELLARPDRARLCTLRREAAAGWDEVAARTLALYDKLRGR